MLHQEDGVQVAIQTIYRELDRAKSLVKKEVKQGDDSEIEDEWTFVGNNDEDEMVGGEQAMVNQAMADLSLIPIDGRLGSGSIGLGGVVLKGAGSVSKDQTTAFRQE